jgi:hypothetical protein
MIMEQLQMAAFRSLSARSPRQITMGSAVECLSLFPSIKRATC